MPGGPLAQYSCNASGMFFNASRSIKVTVLKAHWQPTARRTSHGHGAGRPGPACGKWRDDCNHVHCLRIMSHP